MTTFQQTIAIYSVLKTIKNLLCRIKKTIISYKKMQDNSVKSQIMNWYYVNIREQFMMHNKLFLIIVHIVCGYKNITEL